MEMLIGNLTRNAETRVTSKGKTVVNFSIAINDSYQANGETITNTTYVECGYWTKGNIAPYLKSGTLLVLFGRLLEPSAFINDSGEAQARNRFFVERIKFVNSKNKNRAEMETVVADDLPF